MNNMLASWDSFSFGFGQIDRDLASFYSFWNKKKAIFRVSKKPYLVSKNLL